MRCAPGGDASAFFRIQNFPFARRQSAEPEISNPHADQPERRMADYRRHFANLPVLAFNQLQTDPAIRNTLAKSDWRIARRQGRARHSVRAVWRNYGALRRAEDCVSYLRLRLQNPRAARQGLPALNQNPRFQFLQTFRRRDFFHLRPILPLMRVTRMQQLFVPRRFITQQQQSFGIRVEPADGINVFRKTEFRQRAIRRAIAGELRQHAEWFVECDEHSTGIFATESQRAQRKIVLPCSVSLCLCGRFSFLLP